MKTPAQSISQDSCEENEIPEVALGTGLLTQSAFSGGGVGGCGGRLASSLQRTGTAEGSGWVWGPSRAEHCKLHGMRVKISH